MPKFIQVKPIKVGAHPPTANKGKASNPEEYNLDSDKLPEIINFHIEKVHQVLFYC